MFRQFSDKPIDPPLRDIAERTQQQNPSLLVLAARQFCYKVYQTPVELTFTSPRRFNIVEEFILRAGIELSTPPTENELATVLGLDSVFVNNTIRTLQTLQTLKNGPGEPISITPIGRQFYHQGTVPQLPKTKVFFALDDPLLPNLIFQSTTSEVKIVDLPELILLNNNPVIDVSSLPIQEIQQVAQSSILGLHVPEEGKIIVSRTITSPAEIIWRTISIFVIFDIIEERVIVQFRRKEKILDSGSKWLQALVDKGKVSLEALCELSDALIKSEREAILANKNQEVEQRLEKIQDDALEIAKSNLVKTTKASNKSIVLLREDQIRQTFLSTLESACYNIIIYSPWVSEAVVDDDFIQLLQRVADRGVWVLIGHGISRREEDEDRPIPAEVEAKLKGITTPDGLPAVQVFWLGNSHAKEVVVDRKIYLCGSQNWLSYRGERLPRGETVCQVTDSDTVEKAYDFLANRFQSHAQLLWDEAVNCRNSNLAIAALCVWGALGMEEEALNKIQQNYLELFPRWLKVLLQGLRSRKISSDASCLKAALLLLHDIKVKDPNINLIRQKWRQVIGAIATDNLDAALTLLNNETWSQFTRLGIADSSISPEDFISTCAVNQTSIRSNQEQRKILKKRRSKRQLI